MQKIKDQIQGYCLEIRKERGTWNYLNEFGGQDPFWPDGCNMNLTRNHIIEAKGYIKELCEENDLPLPEDYNLETPPEVSMTYMARPEEIRREAKAKLEQCLKDNAYQYIIRQTDLLDMAGKSATGPKAVIMRIEWLKKDIESDDLVGMRRTCRQDLTQQLADAKQQIMEMREESESKKGQLDLFGLMARMEG